MSTSIHLHCNLVNYTWKLDQFKSNKINDLRKDYKMEYFPIAIRVDMVFI